MGNCISRDGDSNSNGGTNSSNDSDSLSAVSVAVIAIEANNDYNSNGSTISSGDLFIFQNVEDDSQSDSDYDDKLEPSVSDGDSIAEYESNFSDSDYEVEEEELRDFTYTGNKRILNLTQEEKCSLVNSIIGSKNRFPLRQREKIEELQLEFIPSLMSSVDKFLHDLEEDIFDMITDRRKATEEYKGLDSERDTVKEVKFMLQTFPEVLSRRKGTGLCPVHCILFQYGRTTNLPINYYSTHLSSHNLKAIPFLFTFIQEAIKSKSFKEEQKGGLRFRNTSHWFLSPLMCLAGERVNVLSEDHNRRVDDAFLVQLNKLKEHDILDEDDMTQILHDACTQHYFSERIFQFLVESAPGILARNVRPSFRGKIVLHHAVRMNDIERFCIVLDAGIRLLPITTGITLLFRKNRDGKTPYQQACEIFKHERVEKIIHDIVNVRYSQYPTDFWVNALVSVAIDKRIHRTDCIYFLLRRNPLVLPLLLTTLLQQELNNDEDVDSNNIFGDDSSSVNELDSEDHNDNSSRMNYNDSDTGSGGNNGKRNGTVPSFIQFRPPSISGEKFNYTSESLLKSALSATAMEQSPIPLEEVDNTLDESEYEYEDDDGATASSSNTNAAASSTAPAQIVDEDTGVVASSFRSSTSSTNLASVTSSSVEDEESETPAVQQPSRKKWREPSRAAVSMSIRAQQETSGSKRRLALDLYRIMNQDTNKAGFSLAPQSEDSMEKWTIKLFQFDPDSNLAKDMMVVGINNIELEMKFPEQYPFEPPFVRVVKPKFKRQTGFVMNGALCMELLTKDGWNPINDIESVVVSIRSLLVIGDGRLQAATEMTKTWYETLLLTAQEEEARAISNVSSNNDVDDGKVSEQEYTATEAQEAYSHLSDYHKKEGWDTSGWWDRNG